MTKADITFDGTFEGLLTIVHAHYYDKIDPISIRDHDSEAVKQLQLDGFNDGSIPHIIIETDYDKAEKVYASLRKKHPEAARAVYHVSLSPEKLYHETFQYIVLCFKHGTHADDHKTLDFVMSVIKTSRYVGREAHLLTGFCRFSETVTGVYYCDISPVNDVLPILAEHFCERFMFQPFVIHDIKRGTAVIYDTKNYVIQEVGNKARFETTESDAAWQRLWSMFHATLANESRKSKKLHRQMMPLRFRKHLTEFKELEKLDELKPPRSPLPIAQNHVMLITESDTDDKDT
jgi:probable DNA metabolism protein